MSRSKPQVTNSYLNPPQQQVQCPVPNCIQQFPYKSIHHFRTHFNTHPKAAIFRLTPEELSSVGIFRCFECRHEVKIYSKEGCLRNHSKQHTSSRDKINSQLAAEIISRNSHTTAIDWATQLSWISTVRYHPMPFRVSLFSRLGKAQRLVVLDLLRELVDALTQSCVPIIDGEHLPTFETTGSPFYKLLSLFEALICGPPGPSEKGNWNKLIDERLQQFRSAKIQVLFERAQLTPMKAPQDRQPIPDQAHREKSANAFANLDNPGKAFRIVTATQPIALANPPIVRALQDLYPSECSYCPSERSNRGDG
ncbi:MAG: hypothetical protein ACREBR_04180 [bacterium]